MVTLIEDKRKTMNHSNKIEMENLSTYLKISIRENFWGKT